MFTVRHTKSQIHFVLKIQILFFRFRSHSVRERTDAARPIQQTDRQLRFDTQALSTLDGERGKRRLGRAERERENVRVRDRARMCAFMRERERERERVTCVYVCV
jgi:hypothetical protein